MADKKYIVVTPLKTGYDRKGTPQIIESGKPVTLDEADAAPLIDCGAIKEPDVIEEEAPAKK